MQWDQGLMTWLSEFSSLQRNTTEVQYINIFTGFKEWMWYKCSGLRIQAYLLFNWLIRKKCPVGYYKVHSRGFALFSFVIASVQYYVMSVTDWMVNKCRISVLCVLLRCKDESGVLHWARSIGREGTSAVSFQCPRM